MEKATKKTHRGIYKRKTGVWWLRYATLDGKIKFESSGSKLFKDAQALMIKRKKEVQDGREPSSVPRIKSHTFRQLSEHYLVWSERQRSYRRKVGIVKLLLQEFGNLPLRHFNTMMVEAYQSKVLNSGRAPATANRHIANIKHMFTKAVDWDMVEEETLKRIRRVKLLPENNRRLRYLSREECQELLEACVPHLRPIVITALNTGMRKGEILGLQWEKNIDLKHGFILLETSKNGERREVPINQTLRETLQSIVRRVDSPYVFTDKNGRKYDNVMRSFKSACTRAGIKDFRFHDLRHTFASQLIMAGADITTVKELLGHKTLTMTLRYSHLAPTHKVKAVELLDGVITSKAM